MRQFEYDLICSLPQDNGIVQCTKDFVPAYSVSRFSPKCTESFSSYYNPNITHTNSSCINWNQYYSKCRQIGENPHHGAISFDHTGLAIVAIFQVIFLSLKRVISIIEGEIMSFSRFSTCDSLHRQVRITFHLFF